MKRKKESTLITVLEWICGITLVAAIVTTVWASLAYRDRNGRFLPGMKETVAEPAKPQTLQSAGTLMPNASDLERDPNATSATPVPQQVQEGAFKNVSVAGFKSLRITANTTEVSVDFYNPEDNKGEYLMTFEMLLPTTSGEYESVYTSGLVDAGQHLRNISLSRPVPMGVYEKCMLRVQPYFAKSGDPTNVAEILFTLTAE